MVDDEMEEIVGGKEMGEKNPKETKIESIDCEREFHPFLCDVASTSV